jgi:hypothetical protein
VQGFCCLSYFVGTVTLLMHAAKAEVLTIAIQRSDFLLAPYVDLVARAVLAVWPAPCDCG